MFLTLLRIKTKNQLACGLMIPEQPSGTLSRHEEMQVSCNMQST